MVGLLLTLVVLLWAVVGFGVSNSNWYDERGWRKYWRLFQYGPLAWLVVVGIEIYMWWNDIKDGE